MTTPTPDETVTRLAEAIAGVTKRRGGHGNPACYMQSAEDALQAIAADPDILRSMGLGRLPTRSEVCDILSGKGWPQNEHLPYWTVADSLVRSGYALPDPQPPEPTLREQLIGVMRETVDSLPWPTPLDKDMYGMVSDRLIAEFDITPKAPRP